MSYSPFCLPILLGLWNLKPASDFGLHPKHVQQLAVSAVLAPAEPRSEDPGVNRHRPSLDSLGRDQRLAAFSRNIRDKLQINTSGVGLKI